MVYIVLCDDDLKDSLQSNYSKAKEFMYDKINSVLPNDHLQFIWISSHIMTLVATAICSVLNSTYKKEDYSPWYQFNLICTVVTYSIVVYQNYVSSYELPNNKNNNTSRPDNSAFHVPLADILKSENTHLLIYSVLWLVSPQNFLKLLPFACYSLLNVGNYFTMEKYPNTQLSKSLTPFIAYIEFPTLSFAAYVDLAVLGTLVVESYKIKSLYSLLIYCFVFCLRFEYSEASRFALRNTLNYIHEFLYINSEMLGFPLGLSYWIVVENSISAILSLDLNEIRHEPKKSSAAPSNKHEQEIKEGVVKPKTSGTGMRRRRFNKAGKEVL